MNICIQKNLHTYLHTHTHTQETNLQVVDADGGAIVHGVEGGNFVDTHWGHIEDLGNLVHRRQGHPASAVTSGRKVPV
jgi:hypothetical protein